MKTLREYRDEWEKILLEKILGETKGNISRAAFILKVDRCWLMIRADELGIPRRRRPGAPKKEIA